MVPCAEGRARLISAIRAIEPARRSVDDWLTLGRMLVYSGFFEGDELQIDDAVEALREAAECTPPSPDAALDLAWVLLVRGLSALALPYARRATELMPERRDAWSFYATACDQRGRRQDAIEAMRRACACSESIPSDKELLADLESGRVEPARLPVMMLFLAERPEEERSAFADERDYLKYRIFVANQMLRDAPRDVELLHVIARLRYELGQPEELEDMAARLLAIDPSHVETLFLLARSREKSGRIDDAREVYQKILEHDPDHVIANCNLATRLLDEGDARGARKLFNRALAVDAEHPLALDGYGNTIAAIEGDFAREADYHRRAIALDPSRVEFRLNLCFALLQAGQLWEAEKAWRKHRKAIESDPEKHIHALRIRFLLAPPDDPDMLVAFVEHQRSTLGGRAMTRVLERALDCAGLQPLEDQPEFLNYVGMLAGHCGHHELSLRAFQAAEGIAGAGEPPTLNVAVALEQLGRYEEALSAVRRCDLSLPRAPTILANLLRGAGRREEALEAYREAARRDKGFLLPISNGTNLGIRLNRLDAVEEMQEALRYVEGHELEAALLKARLEFARGRPWRVVDILLPVLAARARATVMRRTGSTTAQSSVDALLGTMGLEEPGEPVDGAPGPVPDAEEMIDFSLPGQSEPEEDAWFLLTRSLTGCFRPQGSQAVQQLLVEHLGFELGAEWGVLQAENARQTGQFDEFLPSLTVLDDYPPALITRSLHALESGQGDEAKRLAERSLSVGGCRAPCRHSHPHGATEALGRAVLAAIELDRVGPDAAMDIAREAVECDPASPVAASVLMGVLQTAERPAEAIDAALLCLQRAPGDPHLLSLVTEALLERKEFDRADAVLQEQREALGHRNNPSLAWLLGERIARAQLEAGRDSVGGSPPAETEDPHWFEHLEPESRGWLRAVMTHAGQRRELGDALAMYLGKVAELELVRRLVVPFRDAVGHEIHDGDARLGGISDYLTGRGRAPGIGAIRHALRVASERGTQRDGPLVMTWRRYIRSLPWPGAASLRSTLFLDRLDVLSRVRNRVAHVGTTTESELQTMLEFLIDGTAPGDFFRGLGVEPPA